ncbi:MAG: ROK family protein [Phycisphaerales bacterium]
MCCIGIDIGKTNIKLVVLDRAGEVVGRQEIPTPGDARVVDVIHEMAQPYRQTPGHDVSLGLSAPGLVGPDTSRVVCLPGGRPAIEGVDWTEELNWHARVPILNDAHAALVAESRIGAARGCRHAVLLTLGTGVGGAVLVNGQPLQGKSGKAGHVGHISIHPDWPVSLLGMPGSLEYAFGDGSVPQRSGGLFPDTRALVEAHEAGDERATSIWRDAVGHLARGVATLANIFDPEVIVIGGGITRAGDALFLPLCQAVAQLEWLPTGQPTPIVPARFGSEAGAIGAALYAREQTLTGGEQ